MKTLELKKNLYYVGVIDHALKVFDVAVRTDYGTSYNSYLLKTSEGAIVFEAAKLAFKDEYLEHLSSLVSFDEIKYIFVTHTEPDHSGAIAALLEKNPDITVVASFAALKNLEKIIRKPFNKMQMAPNGIFSFGGYTFQFVSGLLLHWPDVMFTYIKELKVLVSCDAFGAHFASDAILLSQEKDQEGYHAALKYYFDNIMGPFASYVLQACDRVEKLDIDMICPGHGCVIDEKVHDQIELYRQLALPLVPHNDMNKVTIVYATAYGYTREMALYLKKRFEEDGKEVAFYEIDALNYGNIKTEIIQSIYNSGIVLLGSPTLVGDAICLFYDILGSIFWTVAQGKKGSAFGDYGWSGEAVQHLSERMKQLHFTVVPGYRVNFKMDDEAMKGLEDYYETLR